MSQAEVKLRAVVAKGASMQSLREIMRDLSPEGPLPDIIDLAVSRDSRLMRPLADALFSLGHFDAAMALELLMVLPDFRHTENEEIEQTLDRLTRLKMAATDPSPLLEEIRNQAMRASMIFNECLARKEYERAANICERMLVLCPGLVQVNPGITRLAQSVRVQKPREELQAMHNAALACADRADHAGELALRLQLHHHPLRDCLNARLVFYNCVHAIKHVLAAEKDTMPAQDIALARDLLATVAATPVTPVRQDIAFDEVASWERCERMMLEAIDLDAIFLAPAAPTSPLPTSFMGSDGTAMQIQDVAARARDVGARAVFACSSSPEYFARYGRIYLDSILRNCDCDFLVVICLCVPHEDLATIVGGWQTPDRRLIFCADGFAARSHAFRIYAHYETEPLTIPTAYYASAALIRLDWLLANLRLPVFVTGIDTVLQRGVVDLLEQFADADIVLNKVGCSVPLESQFVNNIVLAFPTQDALLFTEFLKTYMHPRLLEVEQVGGIDQICLNVAKHHVMAHGSSRAIGYFGQFDINTMMFTRYNYRAHLGYAERFRFLNMFVGAFDDDKRLTIDQLSVEAA